MLSIEVAKLEHEQAAQLSSAIAAVIATRQTGECIESPTEAWPDVSHRLMIDANLCGCIVPPIVSAVVERATHDEPPASAVITPLGHRRTFATPLPAE